jgi:hypothetical protein
MFAAEKPAVYHPGLWYNRRGQQWRRTPDEPPSSRWARDYQQFGRFALDGIDNQAKQGNGDPTVGRSGRPAVILARPDWMR